MESLIATVLDERFIVNKDLPPRPSGDEIIGTLVCDVGYAHSPLRQTDLRPSNGHCWHPLFRYCQIVQGYPIPSRPRGQDGLELSLEMMGALACAERVTAFCSTLIVKGFATLLYATSASQDCITWHLAYNSDGSPIAFSDDRVRVGAEKEEELSILQPAAAFGARHIVGWTEEIQSHAGKLPQFHEQHALTECF